MRNSVRWMWIALVLVLSIADVQGQHKPVAGRSLPVAVPRSSKAEGSISLSFVPVAGGPSFTANSRGRSALQLGTVSSGTGARNAGVAVERRQNSMVVSALFGLKLENNGARQGMATLSAFLFQLDPRCDIFVDGVKLGLSARLIQSNLRYGNESQHGLEIEVPSSVSETQGQIANHIGFQVVPN